MKSMKLIPDHSRRPVSKVESAFTLVEMIVAVAVFSLVILATVAMQIYACRVYTLAATKLSATSSSRATLNDIRDKIRQGQIVWVGNYYINTGNPIIDFNPIADGSPQQGNALIIYPNASNTNSFTLMFLQPGIGGTNFATLNSSGQTINTNFLILEVWTNSACVISNPIASYVTNQIVFTALNCTNCVLTNNVNNRLIQIQLFFSQWEYPIAFVGSNEFNAYDYYRVQTKVTRRLVD
jgi:prepilin-type N-terminal cleavage/methylation domain-containing protein